MHAFAASGAAFLLAVLWFDLMFDVQVTRVPGAAALPADILGSISAYYRRVTTEARPMNFLVGIVMLATVLLVAGEIATGVTPTWAAWVSLAAAISAIGLARARIVPNAMRLGRAADTAEEQSRLARSVYGDHVYCFAAMFVVLALQLCAPWLG
jgi:hypothetical protein